MAYCNGNGNGDGNGDGSTVTMFVKFRDSRVRRRMPIMRFFGRIESGRVQAHELAQVVRKFGPEIVTGHPRFSLLDCSTRFWVRRAIAQTANWRLG